MFIITDGVEFFTRCLCIAGVAARAGNCLTGIVAAFQVGLGTVFVHCTEVAPGTRNLCTLIGIGSTETFGVEIRTVCGGTALIAARTRYFLARVVTAFQVSVSHTIAVRATEIVAGTTHLYALLVLTHRVEIFTRGRVLWVTFVCATPRDV